MLYDNSQLARVYLRARILTSEGSQAVIANQFFRTRTEEILDCVVREMTYVGVGANDGNADEKVGGAAFYSTQDADSEGEEGKVFVWTPTSQ